MTAIGIVYGDLGTSPLYTLQTIVQALGGHFNPASALGVLSLIVWTLIITISIKYCLFVMRADNHGEGGILALMSLIGANGFTRGTRLLAVMGLLGAALVYGDGIITPAISVLSALEGVNVVTTTLKPFVMPAAVAILVVLFAAQRLGTERIGRAFGPIMLLWFIVIALLGVSGIVRNPRVLDAIDPRYALSFVQHSRGVALPVLGGVFLCITGGEALYADMGHIGRAPIRAAWYLIVLPSLLLSYAGQTALLIERGEVQGNPFFLLAPTWAIYPLVVLATVATIIASQAIITGSFSMTRQAMQLAWLPAVNIRQTSDQLYGQIYVPVVNWLMMIGTVSITIAFQSSDRLAGAYGTAVSTTMLLTSCLLIVAMRRIWRWPLPLSLLVGGLFLLVDASFFCANLLKIIDGGWLPLTLGVLIFLVMLDWRFGVEAVRECLVRSAEEPQRLLAQLEAGQIPRVPGTAVFLTRSAEKFPRILIEHVNNMGALHRSAVALRVVFKETPRVAEAERWTIEPIATGLWHAVICFGFIEVPNLSVALRGIKDLDPSIDLEHALYFGTRDLVIRKPGSRTLGHGGLLLFAFLYRNAVKVVDRFHLPVQNVVEIARLLPI
ncbi:MAG TPA: KUP/HAK/KT family potassium transporter [Steroidobacteraceae bacterium]|nr:KUP/HAK/KT family potassium transporter [Steroidobacteraceae bacterium]